jgi:cytochrome c-type biogenesis protein
MEPFFGFINRFKKHFALMERIVGVLLIGTGLAFLTGGLTSISFWLLETFPDLAKLG